MRKGGVIIPIPQEDGPNRRSCGACVWGQIITEPKRRTEHTRKGNRERLDFIVRTAYSRTVKGHSERGIYQRMYITQESMFFWLMVSAEKGDTFVFFGEYQESDYYAKERQKNGYYAPDAEKVFKTARDFSVQFVIPAQAIADPIGYNQRFSREADRHYSFQEEDGVTENDDEAEPGFDDWG